MDGAREMVRALAQEGQTGGESVREVEGRRSGRGYRGALWGSGCR